MIDCGSQTNPLVSYGSSLRRMLSYVRSRLQWCGGPANSSCTASSSQWIAASGFWCSCTMPSACPIWCSTVPRSPGAVRSQPKFMVRSCRPVRSASLPTADQEPSPCWKPILSSASDRSATSANVRPIPSARHCANPSRTTSRCSFEPAQDTRRRCAVPGTGMTEASASESKKQ
jgi:hypothetical protein